MMGIGFKIKKLREQKDWSQEELVLRLGTSQASLSKIENGTNEKIDFLLMQKVCDIFKVEPQYFLENETIINHVENNNGIVYNKGVLNMQSPELLDNILKVQEQITQLITSQNILFKEFLQKK